MKYFPLVWAALSRRPTQSILTLLSVSAAFTLFGVVIGFDASVQRLVNIARPNLVYVNSRFGSPMPLAYRDRIARLPGVSRVAFLGGLVGYYRDKRNFVFPIMLGEGSRYVMTIFPLTPPQWSKLQSSRTGIFASRLIAARYHLKAGDAFPVLTTGSTRQDGSDFWPFTVEGVVDDSPQYLNGYVLGNYNYLDETRPTAQRSTVLQFQLLVQNPDRASNTARVIDAMFANSGVPTNSITEKDSYSAAARAGINIPFVTNIVAGAGLFMILFLTGNGIAEFVRERIPEFAVLKTLGFSDGTLMALVSIEASIPCLLGAILGLGLASAIAEEVPKLTPPNPYNFILPVPYMSRTVLISALVSAVLVALVSAVIPILRVKRLAVASVLSGQQKC